MIPENSILYRCKSSLEKGYSIALVKIPNSSEIECFISSEAPRMLPIKLSHIPARSFVFAPYASGNMAYQLIPDEIVRFPVTALSGIKLQWHMSTSNTYLAEADFLHYVKHIVKQAKEGTMQKVVAARCAHRNTGIPFDALALYLSLCQHYTDSYCYLFSTADAGTWIGASPELLLSSHSGMMQTVALAGTKHEQEARDWSDKEKAEQHWVELFIENVLKRNRIEAFEYSGVHTVKAGSLFHLKSTYGWRVDSQIESSLVYKLLAMLNPTPAVCGLPALEASQCISENERMERRFYSGFSGIIDPNTGFDLFVSLRCLELTPNGVTLYAGAGITKDSVAEMEWKETERKMHTLGKWLSGD